MSGDPSLASVMQAEAQAYLEISKALAPLPIESARRVLLSAADAAGMSLGSGRRGGAPSRAVGARDAEPAELGEGPSFGGGFGELFAAAAPKTDAEKALVSGYWLQVVGQNNDFDAFAANNELRRLGYPVGNITRAYDTLMKETPKPVIQVKKSGTTKQARKRYRLTEAGIKRIRAAIEETE